MAFQAFKPQAQQPKPAHGEAQRRFPRDGSGNAMAKSQFISRLLISVGTAAVLAGCGGGGGGGADAPSGPSETPQGGGSTPVVGVQPLVQGDDAFLFQVGSALAAEGALDRLAGGEKLFAAWNPRNPQTALKPGMKVQFFGDAPGCSDTLDEGPVTTGLDADYAEGVARTTIATAAVGARRWVPSGATPACDAALRERDGPSMVHLNADGTLGGVGLYTTTGPQADGRPGFLRPYSAAGQNGRGANAAITGTFVAFRQPWFAEDPVQPWTGTSATARVLSVQSIGAALAGESLAASTDVQVKQQMSADFINVECAKAGITAARPCQLEYLADTAIVRAGVDDWATVAWFQQGRVWFDPGQGGAPVVSGPLKEAGRATTDADSGLPLFVSQGAASRHGAFRNQTFDLRIPFAHLQNALRIVVGRKLGRAPADVTEAQIAAMWGARWNDPSAWALLSTNIGQEVHNPLADAKAYVGGAFRKLYVGPQS